MFELAYSSGLRRSEVLSINLENLDIPGELVKVRGKGGRERIVPVSQTALSWLERYLEVRAELRPGAQPAMFLGRGGRRLHPSSVDRAVKRMLVASQLLNTFTLHSLRHAFATHMLEAGADLRYVQEILGHTSPSTTAIYLNYSAEFLRKVYSRCHPHG
jgi:site-specific recombinase XerD